MDAQSVSRQRLDKHDPVNTQQWKLCSLWAMLQLVARLVNNRGGCGFCVVRSAQQWKQRVYAARC
jgi:hypothetical protein